MQGVEGAAKWAEILSLPAGILLGGIGAVLGILDLRGGRKGGTPSAAGDGDVHNEIADSTIIGGATITQAGAIHQMKSQPESPSGTQHVDASDN